MAIFHMSMKVMGRSSRNTVAAVAYRSGVCLRDDGTGEKFNYSEKPVDHVALYVPEGSAQWAIKLQEAIVSDRESGVQYFSDLCESAEKRKDSQVYREIEMALPKELSFEKRKEIVRGFSKELCDDYGVMVLANHHDEVGNPHVHMLLATRKVDEKGLSSEKALELNQREFLKVCREKAALHINNELVMAGFMPVSNRSFADRGIELDPGVKLGYSNSVYKALLREGKTPEEALKLIEEKDLSQYGLRSRFTYHRAAIKEFLEVKISNQYRVARRPEVVLDVLTEKKAVFTSSDVRDVLGQYIYDKVLWEKVEARLFKSGELVELGTLGDFIKGDDKIVAARGELLDEKVYTARAMMALENKVVEASKILSATVSHRVKEETVSSVVERFNKKYEAYGSLAPDQVEAIKGIIESRQLSCVSGPAGSGKSTILQAAQEIWQDSGYRVVGLAPTNQAKESLRQAGIESFTVHKLLGSSDQGRSLYDHKTVLMVDEAGMMDVKIFSKLLSYVERQNVKVVFIGDPHQLGSVGAGRAFESVLRASETSSSLTTIVRQKEEWQRESTKDFATGNAIRGLSAYQEKGHISIVKEKLLDIKTLDLSNKESKGPYIELIKQYNLSNRVSGVLYSDMINDVKAFYSGEKEPGKYIKEHKNYALYREHIERRDTIVDKIASNMDVCKHLFKPLGVDPVVLFKSQMERWQDSREWRQHGGEMQSRAAVSRTQDHGLDLKKPSVAPVYDLNFQTRQELVKDFTSYIKENPQSSYLIMAKTLRDQEALTESVRTGLKQQGILKGTDTRVEAQHISTHDMGKKEIRSKALFLQEGDRVRFLKEDKGRGVVKGDIGTILSIEKDRIEATVRRDKEEKTVSFSTNLYKALDYGWVSTIYSAQSQTVDKAFVLGTSTMTRQDAYVSLTRHREDVKMYVPSTEFVDSASVCKYLSTSSQKITSLDARSAVDDHMVQRSISPEKQAPATFKDKALQKIKDEFGVVRDIGRIAWTQGVLGKESNDVVQENKKNFDIRVASREERLEIYGRLNQDPFGERSSQKEKDTSMGEDRKQSLKEERQDLIVQKESKPFYDRDTVLKTMTRSDLESIADSVFSTKHKKVSNTDIRYGKNGSVVLSISESKFGLWKDFESNEGGDIFMLASKAYNKSYGEVIAEIAESKSVKPEMGYHAQKREEEKQVREEKESKALLEKWKKDIETATNLYKASKSSNGTIVEKYLQNRGLSGPIPEDIRYVASRKDYSLQKSFPAMVSFVRDNKGEITGFQEIYLDKKTGNKSEEVKISKRSKGTCRGSFVDIRSPENNKDPKVLFLTEGVETGISVSKSLPKGTDEVAVKAGLGRYNFRNIEVSKETEIVLCADYDGKKAATHEFIKEDVKHLEEKGHTVHVVWPEKKGDIKKDFNNLLQEKGESRVGQAILSQLPETLKEKHIYDPIDMDKVKGASADKSETISIKERPFEDISGKIKGFLEEQYKEDVFSDLNLTDKHLKNISERTVECLIERQEKVGELSYKDIKVSLKRSIFEKERYEEVKSEWKTQFLDEVKEGKSDPKSYLFEVELEARVHAEAEGKLYENDLRESNAPQKTYEKEAEIIHNEHLSKFDTVKKEILDVYDISEKTANLATYMAIRHGVRGDIPTDNKLDKVVETAFETLKIEKKYKFSSKEESSYFKATVSRDLLRSFYDGEEKYNKIEKAIEKHLEDFKEISTEQRKMEVVQEKSREPEMKISRGFSR